MTTIERAVPLDQPVDHYLTQCYEFAREALKCMPVLCYYLADDDDWAYIEEQWMRRYWSHHNPSLLRLL